MDNRARGGLACVQSYHRVRRWAALARRATRAAAALTAIARFSRQLSAKCGPQRQDTLFNGSQDHKYSRLISMKRRRPMHYYVGILIKFAIGFMIVIAHMNLTGKTQLSQFTPIDFIGNFILGGIIGGVIYSDSIPLYQYVIVLLIGIGFISGLNALSKNVVLFRSMAIGRSIPVIKDGEFLTEIIRKNKRRIDLFNITSQIHTQGIKSLQLIYYAQIEPSGQLTAFCDKKELPSLILIAQGNIISHNLEQIGKDKEWLMAELEHHHTKAEDVFVAEFWDGKLNFTLADGKWCA